MTLPPSKPDPVTIFMIGLGIFVGAMIVAQGLYIFLKHLQWVLS